MKVEDSKYIKQEHERVELPFGIFYFFKDFLISELNQGIHFSWKKVKKVADLAAEFYGEDNKVVYISNRVNSYSIEPQSWLKFDKEYNFFKASAIIAYDMKGGLSVVLEKLFSQKRIQKFTDLDSAIDWALKYK
jgi:hypothetical protein